MAEPRCRHPRCHLQQWRRRRPRRAVACPPCVEGRVHPDRPARSSWTSTIIVAARRRRLVVPRDHAANGECADLLECAPRYAHREEGDGHEREERVANNGGRQWYGKRFGVAATASGPCVMAASGEAGNRHRLRFERARGFRPVAQTRGYYDCIQRAPSGAEIRVRRDAGVRRRCWLVRRHARTGGQEDLPDGHRPGGRQRPGRRSRQSVWRWRRPARVRATTGVPMAMARSPTTVPD